jgi:hypothetical protein
MIKVLGEGEGAVREFRHDFESMQPGSALSFDDVWNTSGAAEGAYRVVGFVLYEGKCTDPMVVHVSTSLPEPVIEDLAFKGCISEKCPTSVSVTGTDPSGGVLSYAWEALDGGSIFGSGASVSFKPLASGPHPCPYRLKVTATSDKSGLAAEETAYIWVKLAGDVNGDGAVNVLDKVQLRNHFGQSGAQGWIAADVNCDGAVNILDKVQVRNQFGQSGCLCD